MHARLCVHLTHLQLRDLAVFGEHLPPEALHHGVALRPLLFQLRQQRSILSLQPAAALLGFSERALLALVPGGVVVLKRLKTVGVDLAPQLLLHPAARKRAVCRGPLPGPSTGAPVLTLPG